MKAWHRGPGAYAYRAYTQPRCSCLHALRQLRQRLVDEAGGGGERRLLQCDEDLADFLHGERRTPGGACARGRRRCGRRRWLLHIVEEGGAVVSGWRGGACVWRLASVRSCGGGRTQGVRSAAGGGAYVEVAEELEPRLQVGGVRLLVDLLLDHILQVPLLGDMDGVEGAPLELAKAEGHEERSLYVRRTRTRAHTSMSGARSVAA